MEDIVGHGSRERPAATHPHVRGGLRLSAVAGALTLVLTTAAASAPADGATAPPVGPTSSTVHRLAQGDVGVDGHPSTPAQLLLAAARRTSRDGSIVAEFFSLTASEGASSETAAPGPPLPQNARVLPQAAGDIDGDGLADINEVVLSSTAGHRVTARRGFNGAPLHTYDGAAVRRSIGDVDGDGAFDALIADIEPVAFEVEDDCETPTRCHTRFREEFVVRYGIADGASGVVAWVTEVTGWLEREDLEEFTEDGTTSTTREEHHVRGQNVPAGFGLTGVRLLGSEVAVAIMQEVEISSVHTSETVGPAVLRTEAYEDTAEVSVEVRAFHIDGTEGTPFLPLEGPDELVDVRVADHTGDGVDDLLVGLVGHPRRTASCTYAINIAIPTLCEDVQYSSRRVLVGVLDGASRELAWLVDVGGEPYPYLSVLGDVDGDGGRDLSLGQTWANTVSVMNGSSGASLWSMPRESSTVIAIDDVDGDALDDVLVWYNDVAAGTFDLERRSGKTGRVRASTQRSIDRGPDDWYRASGLMTHLDHDGDGAADIALWAASCHESDGTCTTGAWVESLVGNDLADLGDGSVLTGAADVDGDGRDELLTLRVSAFDFHRFDVTGDLEAVAHDGAVYWRLPDRSLHQSASTVGDVDGDGVTDLLTRHPSDPAVTGVRDGYDVRSGVDASILWSGGGAPS